MPPVDRREVAAIFAGGALGTLLRAALAGDEETDGTDDSQASR